MVAPVFLGGRNLMCRDACVIRFIRETLGWTIGPQSVIYAKYVTLWCSVVCSCPLSLGLVGYGTSFVAVVSIGLVVQV